MEATSQTPPESGLLGTGLTRLRAFVARIPVSSRLKIRKMLVILGILLLNPFDMQSELQQTGQRFVDRITSARYDAAHAAAIRVVLFPDAAVGPEGWPPSMETWATLLERLIDAEPAAILFDIELGGERENLDLVAETMRQSKVPLIMVDSGRRALTLQQTNAQRPACAEIPTRDGERQETYRIPPASPLWTDQPRRRLSSLPDLIACTASELAFYDWPITHSDERLLPLRIQWSRLAFEPGDRLTIQGYGPSLLLAAMSCSLFPAGNWRRPAWCDNTAWLTDPQIPPLLPIWPLAANLWAEGESLPPGSDDTLNRGCQWLRPMDFVGRFQAILFVSILELLGDRISWIPFMSQLRLDGASAVQPDARQRASGQQQAVSAAPCPHPALVDKLIEGGDPLPSQRHALRGSILVVGDGRINSADRHRTPLHGTLPGAFLHAVALENLMTLGPNYRQPDKNLAGIARGQIVDWTIELLTILLAALLANYRDRLLRKGGISYRLEALAMLLAPDRRGMAISLGLLILIWIGLCAFMASRLSGAWLAAVILVLFLAWLCKVFLGASPDIAAAEPRPFPLGMGHAHGARGTAVLGIGLTRVFRLTVMFAIIGMIAASYSLGMPTGSPLAVILIGIAIMFPILDQSPLDEPMRDMDRMEMKGES